MNKILITGGCGFIGANTAEFYLKKGYEVIVIDNLSRVGSGHNLAWLKRLEGNNQIIFRYCNREGEITEESNPNGSLSNIAGIVNKRGNVLGMMPHPERASDPLLRYTDGQKIFKSTIEHIMLGEQTLVLTEAGRR